MRKAENPVCHVAIRRLVSTEPRCHVRSRGVPSPRMFGCRRAEVESQPSDDAAAGSGSCSTGGGCGPRRLRCIAPLAVLWRIQLQAPLLIEKGGRPTTPPSKGPREVLARVLIADRLLSSLQRRVAPRVFSATHSTHLLDSFVDAMARRQRHPTRCSLAHRRSSLW